MTKEEIDLYKNPKLQKLFKEKMGKYQKGDRFITPEDHEYIFLNISTLAPSCLRVPDIVSRDSTKPERGLLGMIGDFDYITFCKANDGKTLCSCTKEHRYIYKYGNTMVEALLRILLDQQQQKETTDDISK